MTVEETEALSISVDYTENISCGQEIIFTVNASGGSGNYKYRPAGLMTVEDGQLVSVYDVSYGNNGSYRENNEFGFTFYASGTYYIRFSVMDMTTFETKTTGLYEYTLNIQDANYPSVMQIVKTVAAQCRNECATDFEKALWLHDVLQKEFLPEGKAPVNLIIGHMYCFLTKSVLRPAVLQVMDTFGQQ